MYFSEQGNVDDDATFITTFLVSFNLQLCCLMQSAVCSLQSAVCSLRSAVCSLQSANVIHRLCFLIGFNYFPFTVFNILASFIYGFNASKALFTQASRFSIKVRRLLQQPTNYVSKLFVLRDLQVLSVWIKSIYIGLCKTPNKTLSCLVLS